MKGIIVNHSIKKDPTSSGSHLIECLTIETITKEMKAYKTSKELEFITGETRGTRSVLVTKTWDYIRAHDLQDPKNLQMIINDDAMKKVFKRDKMHMRDMFVLVLLFFEIRD